MPHRVETGGTVDPVLRRNICVRHTGKSPISRRPPPSRHVAARGTKTIPGFRRTTICYGRTGRGMDWSRHLRKAGHVLGLAKDFIKARLGTAVATLLRPARPPE